LVASASCSSCDLAGIALGRERVRRGGCREMKRVCGGDVDHDCDTGALG
jgi:hypothetical protein